ncbi:MAG: LLM class flavin-dependent oxidoreductase [Gemmatimonadales bacterium]|nr:LLM class flavin-dependent oxidoreductase [Gemmatimonadales bacterium]
MTALHESNTTAAPRALRCLLVGDESLLAHCGEALLRAGHGIVGVATQSADLAAWAERAGLPRVELLADGPRADMSFDVLFSIGNRRLLPAATLERARVAAINFHDGPLPEHGGLNVPAWAIMLRATEHGVAWHRMTARADAGAVVAQRRFPIAPDETTLTLNTRCFEAGIESFGEVLAALADGTLPAAPQGRAPLRLSRRDDRPPAAGTLDWRRPAAELCALVRGLDHGAYANPITTAKALLGDAPFEVPALSPLGRSSGATPGSIVALDDEGLTVATSTDDVRLPRFRALDGEVLSARDVALRQNLRQGDVLRLSDEIAARLTALAEATAPHEPWWIGQLARCEPGTLPFPERAGSAHAPPASIPLDLSSLPVVPGHPPAQVALALVAGLVARLRGRADFAVSYTDPTLTARCDGVAAWYAPSVPVQLHLSFDASLEALVARVSTDLRHAVERGPLATDLALRQPSLRALPHARGTPLPIALVLAHEPDAVPLDTGSEVRFVIAADGSRGRLHYDAARLSPELAASLVERLARLARGFRDARALALGRQPLLAERERQLLLTEWNATELPIDEHRPVDRLVHERARLDPQRTALVCRDRRLSYAELDARVSRIAHALRARGVGADDRVAVLVDRDIELVVALLAVQRAGGAYVPLDPDYPAPRLALMLRDSGAQLVLTRDGLALPALASDVPVATLEALEAAATDAPATPPEPAAAASQLAYVIYTSGSTGTPKGVMVEHRNLLNFVAAMDQRLGTLPGTWLAVTSASFDISVLELLWTLARGYTVVLHREGRFAARADRPVRRPTFSLFYFASDASAGDDRYRLLLDGARFADARGFEAVWTPERHFHAFGGIYPNPAVTGAALAGITHRVRIRAGSVVLPLHHPARVAEDWAVVDNLSHGRVDLGFAAGWQPNDFVLRPEAYAEHKQVMLRDIEVVRKLWRGEAVAFPGVTGRPVAVRTLPRPIQPELPIWLTVAGNPETYRQAGQIGANLLTHLLGQSIEELAAKLALYRQAWREAGHPGEGRVTLMLHTFVGDDDAAVKAAVREPLRSYLASAVDLVSQYAWSFPALKRRPGDDAKGGALDLEQLTPAEREGVLDYAFERYYETSGLFGTPEGCLARVDQLGAIGVDEIACLVDFGVPVPTALAHLEQLDRLRIGVQRERDAATDQHGLAALIARHGVTHLQGTPSLARLLLAEPASRAALAAVQHLLVGGEALTDALAAELRAAVPRGRLHNMYGPTETTVWSTAHDVGAEEHPVPIGRPLANTRVYVLDPRGEPVPVGVPGELHIGGLGVARGYLDRPDATDERFVADPFAGTAAARMYRTGDRVRWRADGRLEFLGRLDQQVKLSGYRIELGEIEAALLQQPGVREAVVLALVPRTGRLDAGAVRDALRQLLPAFMVPAHVLVLDRLPTTPNGKVDRRALPAPSAATAPDAAPASQPVNQVEEAIAAVWRELLQLPQVSREANFFDLGGHSLLAVQVHRRLRERYPERALSITDLFRYPTIATLAGFLGGGAAEPSPRRSCAPPA